MKTKQSRSEQQKSELKRLGRRIKQGREREVGLTQEKLADKIGVTGAYLCQIELGNRLPSLGLCSRIAKALPKAFTETELVRTVYAIQNPEVRSGIKGFSKLKDVDKDLRPAIEDLIAKIRGCRLTTPYLRKVVKHWIEELDLIVEAKSTRQKRRTSKK